MQVRDAVLSDLPYILAIHNEAVRSSTAIWTDSEDDLAGRERWFTARRAQGYPVLVAIHGDELVGYASFGDFRAFDGYRHTVENSVYVRSDQRRSGVGLLLLTELVARARASDKHAIIGGIEAGNAASIALHERVGFVKVAYMPEVGQKFGRWLDLVFVQMTLTGR